MPEKILIVDDHADTVDMLQLVLRDAGYAVRSARNAEEAYRKAQTFVPDLLLLDLMLPDLNAYELMDRLRNAPATARTPMMVMTGLPGELPQVLATNAGADGYIRKPFEFSKLLAKVSSAMHAHALRWHELQTAVPA